MTLLSSPTQTALQRYVFPLVLSLILLGTLGAIVFPPAPPVRVIVAAVTVFVLVALVYFLAYRVLIYRLADSVILDGDVLRVKRGRQVAVVPVQDIAAIHSRTGFSPETITLDLVTESEVGSSVVFIPPARFPNGQEHSILAPLRAAMPAA